MTRVRIAFFEPRDPAVMTSELATLAHDLKLKYLLVSYSDLAGVVRAKLVPASAIGEMQQVGAAFAGFATWLDMTPADPDVLAVPDPASLLQLPWKPEVGWVAADLFLDGQPLAQAPRNVLKRSINRAAEAGYELRTGVECEFFLLSPEGSAIADPNDRQPKPCYDQQALMRRFDLIAEICDAMQALGWQPYQNDHEDAHGQFEMNWLYADALTTADRHTFFKYMVRTLAEQRGLRATFMPKPFSHLTGNGCHIHLSLWDRQGTNLFAEPTSTQELSKLGGHFLGGVLHSAPALCAFTNPAVNSYRRIHAPTTASGATWSPNSISYSGNNRTHMIRIPGPGRFELRLPDGAANPYLLPAAILHAGLDGLTRKLEPGPQLETNAYDQPADSSQRLPETLSEALDAFERSSVLVDGLGERFSQAYLRTKRSEWRSYSQHVSTWEREHTLDC
jgi:glutamine synthetase